MASKNNKDSFAVDRPESSDNESDQEGKILETHIDYTKLTDGEKIFLRCEENAEIIINDPPKLNIKTPGYSVIERPYGYKNDFVLPPFPIRDEVDEENQGYEMATLASIAASKTLDTVDEAHIKEDDSKSDYKTDTDKPDHLDLIDDKNDDADDKSEQENMTE